MNRKNNLEETMRFSLAKDEKPDVEKVLRLVFDALQQRGYDPINQMVGYLLSGDPAYITSFNNARNLIRRIERDELLEVLLRSYLKNCGVL